MNDSYPDGLRGRMLIAAPTLEDANFRQTIILVCAHGAHGAMGVTLNRPMKGGPSFEEVLRQTGALAEGASAPPTRVVSGGPVEPQRGFLIHGDDYMAPEDSSDQIAPGLRMTVAIEALKAIAEGRGPERRILALGYAGWGPGQVEAELRRNDWLIAPADADLAFAPASAKVWSKALESIGAAPGRLAGGGLC